MTDLQQETPSPAGTPKTPTVAPRPRGRVAGTLAGWNWRSHPPPWAAVNIACALLIATWNGHKLGLPPTVALIGGGIGALGAAAAAMIAEQGAAVIWWRIGCWTIPALWASAALHWSPWHPVVLVTGLVLAVVGGLLASAVGRARRVAREAAKRKAARGTGLTADQLTTAPADSVWDSEQPTGTSRDALAANWEPRIARVCGVKGARIIDVGLWSQGTGYTLLVDLPRGGVTWRRIADFAEELAEDAELPPDCGVTVKGSPQRRGLAQILVTHRNMMAETHQAPADYSPTSIYQPARIGLLPDGAPITVAFKWAWFVVTGQTDSGKTSMLHLINLYLLRCVDTVVWHIDVGGGGGISRPWVTPWHEGRAGHPNVDWAATTNAEAELMCRAALAIAEGRKRHYRDRLDNGKIICSPDLPHIEIVSDETATLPERVKDLLTKINQTSRASGIRGGTSALRATAEDLPRAIKQHSRLRIGMRVSDADEIRYLFDAPGKVDPELAPHRGSGWFEMQDEDETGKPVGKKYVTPGKGLFLPDTQIDEAAVAVAGLRPALDAASAAMADAVAADGRAYTDRWQRTIGDLFVVDDPGEQAPGDPERAARIREAEARQEELHRTGGSVGERLERLSELRDRILSGDTDEQGGVDQEAFAQLTDGIVDNLADVLAAVDAAGADGIGPKDILQRINGTRTERDQITVKTVQRKLDELIATDAVVRTGRGVYVSAIHQGGTDER